MNQRVSIQNGSIVTVGLSAWQDLCGATNGMAQSSRRSDLAHCVQYVGLIQMRLLKNGYVKPGYRLGEPVTIGYLLNRQALTIRLKWHQIPLNVGGQAATGGPVRVRPPLIYILGVPRNS